MEKLYFYYAAMNAGKSTALLQSAHNYGKYKMDTLLFTPSCDDRYGIGKVAARIGLEADAVMFDENFDFFDFTAEAIEKNQNIHCILVDEAQFLKKTQVLQLVKIISKLERPVMAYGLRTNFMGEPFEGSEYLLSWADELSEIKTICHCGKKATMTMRLDENGKQVREGNQILIGGNERYVAVCRKHYDLGEWK